MAAVVDVSSIDGFFEGVMGRVFPTFRYFESSYSSVHKPE